MITAPPVIRRGRENPAHAFFDPAAEDRHLPIHFAAERDGGGFVVVARIELVVPIDDDAVAVRVKCGNARASVIRGRQEFGRDGFHGSTPTGPASLAWLNGCPVSMQSWNERAMRYASAADALPGRASW